MVDNPRGLCEQRGAGLHDTLHSFLSTGSPSSDENNSSSAFNRPRPPPPPALSRARSRSSAVMHVTPELKVPGSNPGGG